MFAIFIDAYHCGMKDDTSTENISKVRESTIYNIIGIDMDRDKDLPDPETKFLTNLTYKLLPSHFSPSPIY
ncbi:MAG: hypothetical protein ACPL7I_10760, partial [Myxococcota bacterium]